MTMTTDEAAAQLNGSQYLKEGSDALFQAMGQSRLVAVFGGSDDIVYFCRRVGREETALATVPCTTSDPKGS